ncbi:hypothetical protein GWQ44_00195 [Pseudomonas sp. 3MA1]|uniref:hypothetical protein n=1 Tax=Pseudomonas sp. 3MA1 TaxID=2699196 RepID=UPI0023DDBC36|nr:hypothetical protein [Pseudomonas sp. 3MA1]MDF2393949.1 hypothetical protein [Pseudomonas sp. 3MA1]
MDAVISLVLFVVLVIIMAFMFFRDNGDSKPPLRNTETPIHNTEIPIHNTETPTEDERQKIERLLLLNTYDTELTCILAQRLSPVARPLVMHHVVPALLNAGQRDRALVILKELNPPQKEIALANMLTLLFRQNLPEAALALLEHTDNPEFLPPISTLQIYQARGDSESVRRLMTELGALSKQSSAHTLSGPDNLLLARLQYASGLKEEAAVSLQNAWAWVVQHQTFPGEMRAVLLEYLTQGRTQEIPGLTAQLQPANQVTAGAVLLEAEQPELAFDLLAQADDTNSHQTYVDLMQSILEKNQSTVARRLLESAPSEIADHLLLLLLLWHAERNATVEAQALLDSHAMSHERRYYLLLNLWANVAAHAPWRTSLFTQAMDELERLRADETWPLLRMTALEIQVQVQVRLPSLQRDSWLIRNCLDEMARLNEQLQASDRLDKYRVQASLLHQLGETQQAEQLLDKALKLLEEQNDPEFSEIHHIYHRAFIARNYLDIGHLEKSEAIYTQLGQKTYATVPLERELLNNYIEQLRLEEAVDILTLHSMCNESNPLSRLNEALNNLQSTAPERIRRLKQQLLDKLDSEPFWNEPPRLY